MSLPAQFFKENHLWPLPPWDKLPHGRDWHLSYWQFVYFHAHIQIHKRRSLCACFCLQQGTHVGIILHSPFSTERNVETLPCFPSREHATLCVSTSLFGHPTCFRLMTPIYLVYASPRAIPLPGCVHLMYSTLNPSEVWLKHFQLKNTVDSNWQFTGHTRDWETC